MKTFGEKVREKCKENKVTLTDLGKHVFPDNEHPYKAINRLIAGNVEEAKLCHLHLICSKLNTELKYFTE